MGSKHIPTFGRGETEQLFNDRYAEQLILRSLQHPCIVEHNINNKTSLIAISWVNSRYGIKFPLKEISKELKKINFSREENKKILLCVDGVHGFGIENLNSIHELGVDFFAAGCHKWLFGPRGTGLLWCSERGWKRLNPIIPSFEKIAWDHYLEWDNKNIWLNSHPDCNESRQRGILGAQP